MFLLRICIKFTNGACGNDTCNILPSEAPDTHGSRAGGWYGHGSDMVRGGTRVRGRWYGHGSDTVRGGTRLGGPGALEVFSRCDIKFSKNHEFVGVFNDFLYFSDFFVFFLIFLDFLYFFEFLYFSDF